MVRRVVALGCSLALLGVVSIASAADSPTTRPTTRPSGRPGARGGFGMMRRSGPFGGGGMARNGPAQQGDDNQPGPGPRGGFPFGRGGFGPMGGGFAQGGGGAAGGNGPARPSFGRGFGGGGAASNPQDRNLESQHPILSRLDELLMALHRDLMREEEGRSGQGMGMRRGPQPGPMGRFRGEPGRFFQEMQRARMARRWEDMQRGRGYGQWEGRRFGQRGMWGREPFARGFGPFRGEERRGEFRPHFGGMYDHREMQRPGFRGGSPPRGFFGPGRFEREDGYRGGYGRFGPPEERRPMMDRYGRDGRFGPPARPDGFGPEPGRWMDRGGPDQEEGFGPRRPEEGRFGRGRDFGPQDRGPREREGGRFDDPRGSADDQAPPPPGRFPPRWDDQNREGR